MTTNPFARLQNLPPLPNPQPITEPLARLSEATLRECARAHKITFTDGAPVKAPDEQPITETSTDVFYG